MSHLSRFAPRAPFASSPSLSKLLGGSLTVLVAGAMGCAAAGAQAPAAARVSGRALDAHGMPISHAVVRLVSDPAAHGGTWRYTLVGDAVGKFAQEGLAPGTYLVMLFTDGQATDVLESVQLHAGEALQLQLRPGQRSGGPTASASVGSPWMAARR